ncbi:MAG: response regulator [Gammaproteobacteria bacterium]|nr:response regulator [Gammaproteobacteria bacterium]MCP4476302.1 response regulator [Gammaproteobacteria bacterium]
MSSIAKILVIEDVKFAQSALISMLQRFNCDVDGASGGREAIEKISENKYDLILADVDLDDMEGMTIAETVRNSEQESGGHVPIVALTAYGDNFFREKALASGMDDFLVKPLTFDTAQILLNKWIKNKQPQHADER